MRFVFSLTFAWWHFGQSIADRFCSYSILLLVSPNYRWHSWYCQKFVYGCKAVQEVNGATAPDIQAEP